MKVVELNIGSTPALIIGEKSEKVFLFVHGLHGHKEEALAFAEVAVPKGYQVYTRKRHWLLQRWLCPKVIKFWVSTCL